MLGSVSIPLLLSSFRLYVQGPRTFIDFEGYWYIRILLIVTLPLYPAFLALKESILTYVSNTHKVSIDVLENVKYQVAQFIQADIGLESHIQIILSVVLLLLASSETRTITGLEVLFEEETFFYMPTRLALTISISWSLVSCIKSHFKGISKKRMYSTKSSTLLMFLYTSISIMLRVFSYVLFLTPVLGLFGTLRHLQGEMYPMLYPYYAAVNVSDTFYFGDAPNISWSQITRWNYISETNAEPPSFTLYTYFTIEQFFVMLIGIFVINMVLQWLAKRITNHETFQDLSFIDCVIHTISCCFIPHPMEDWDEKQGTVLMHKIRKNLVFKEMMASVLVNFGVNLLLLSPLIILGKCKYFFYFTQYHECHLTYRYQCE